MYFFKFSFLIFYYSGCEISDEGRYLLLYVFRGAEPKNKLFYFDLEQAQYKIEGLLSVMPVADDDFKSSYDVSDNFFVLRWK